jgi:hypothetical protein
METPPGATLSNDLAHKTHLLEYVGSRPILPMGSATKGQITMAAKPTTGQKATDQHARNITTYDLAIGILAIFSLILLFPI